jgi:hypothetical protein
MSGLVGLSRRLAGLSVPGSLEPRPVRAIFRLIMRLFLAFAGLAAHPSLARDAKTFDHVSVIVLENHGFDEALASEFSPFLRHLSRTQGLATKYFGIGHPSLPNYLALIAGDSFGIRNDDPSCFASDLTIFQSCHGLDVETLADQLEAAHLTWSLYAESLPAIGSLQQASPDNGANALYAQKHNPFAYFSAIAKNPSRAQNMKSLSFLAQDLADGPPNFAFIVPNQCHDGHGLNSCGDPAQLIRDYDSFLEKTVNLIRASPHWTENSAIVITFDESESKADNHVAMIVVTKCGGPVTSATKTDHYGLLATLEDGFHVKRLRKASNAASLIELFDRSCR